ncbi:DUF4026 domain-containing protein [Brenneria goodwinii]|uniref:DUF4026 domain-containing protein n=1 Tax=Brenneria goodwinii TaxID=1109412 RepID=UPI0036E849C5
MNNKQQYLDIAAGKGKVAPSTMVVFPSEALNYPLLEKNLEAQRFFTDGEVSYAEDEQEGFVYSCRHGDDALAFRIQILDRSEEDEVKPYYSTDPLSPERLAEVNASPQAVFVECVFKQHPLISYRYQLRILRLLVPDLLLGIDVSAADKAFTPEWLRFQLEDDVLPDVENLYTIHAIYDPHNNPPTAFWFHTHGLTRCGITEVELVIPHTLNSYYGIPELFRNFANNCIENQQVTFNKPILCGQTQAGYEYVVALPFEEGLRHVNKPISVVQLRPLEEMHYDLSDAPEGEFLGDRADRDDVHMTPSCMLFRATEENSALETFFKGFEEQNAIMFWRTNAETYEMSRKAKLRWHYFGRMFENYAVSAEPIKKGFFAKLLNKSAEPQQENEWRFLVKCGIPYGDPAEDEREHMWFIPESMNGDAFSGKLINHPFYIDKMKEGGVYPLDLELITDWAIYYQDDKYTPDTIYKLLGGNGQTH